MKNVQEKVWMAVAKRAYQKIGLPIGTVCKSLKEGMAFRIEVQALGTF